MPMTTISIPLDRNPDLAALVADKEPGEWIKLLASIKAKDSQTLTVRLEECDDCENPESDDDEDTEDEGDETEATPAAPEEKPSQILARKLGSGDGSMS